MGQDGAQSAREALKDRKNRVEHVTRAYRKTDRGLEEIATRANRLSHWLRCALIMVNGLRTDDELTTLIGETGRDTLRTLIDLGLIEPVSTGSGPPSALPSHWPPDEVPALYLPLKLARRRALRWLAVQFGHRAEPLSRRIAQATTPDQLHHALVLSERYVKRAQGEQRAEQFQRDVGLRPTASH